MMKSASEFFVRTEKPVPKACFVLMPFQEGLSAVYEHGIKPMVESLGLECRRADEMYSTQGILGDIWTSIQRAELIIADLTGKNPNVMYELGLSHALWKRVILLAQNRDDVPFDLRAWRVIWYDFTFAGSARLKEELQRAIRAVRTEEGIESELVPLPQTRRWVAPVQSERVAPQEGWLHGIIQRYQTEERRGFVRTESDSFYFNPNYLFSESMEPEEGKRVSFVPLAPLPDTKNPRASKIFVHGSKMKGKVSRVVEGKGYGFADVNGTRETQNLFILIGEESPIKRGSQIECTISGNDTGPIGVDVQTLSEEEDI
jgi:hypothetical protein